MSKLNDTQLVLLSNAAKRDDGALTRLPKLKPEAMEQAAAALLARPILSVAAHIAVIAVDGVAPLVLRSCFDRIQSDFKRSIPAVQGWNSPEWAILV